MYLIVVELAKVCVEGRTVTIPISAAKQKGVAGVTTGTRGLSTISMSHGRCGSAPWILAI